MKKRVLILITVFMLGLMLFGCSIQQPAPQSSQSGSTSASSSTDTKTPDSTLKAGTHIRLSIFGDDARKVALEKIFQGFTDKTGVTVEVVIVPSAEIGQKLAMQIASKTPPEFAWLSERNMPQFLGNNLLEDISALYDDPDYNISDFNPFLLESLKKDGKLYGIPFSIGTRVFYYNKDLFAAKNLPNPGDLYAEGKWTWDEMIKLAEQVTDPSQGIYGLSLFSLYDQKDWLHFYDMLWSHGADFFNSDCSEMIINSPEGIETFQMFSDLIFKSQVHIKPGDQITFETGKIAMDREVISYSSRLRAQNEFDWDIVPNPVGPAGEDVPHVTGVASYHIPKGCKHFNEALAALAYITSAEVMRSEYLFTSFPSPRVSVLSDPHYPDAFKGKPSAESLTNAFIKPMAGKLRVFPTPPNYDAVDVAIRKYLDMFFAQSGSVENILNQMKEEVDPLLKK